MSISNHGPLLSSVYREPEFGPFFRSFIGLDRLGRLMEAQHSDRREVDNYPPHNVERLDDTTYRLTFAVAGFGRSDIDVAVLGDSMTVSGRIKREVDPADKRRFLYQGISSRPFSRKFVFVDKVDVESAEIDNGMLQITLRRIVPEAMRPRRIEITAAPSDRAGAISDGGENSRPALTNSPPSSPGV